MDSLREIKDWLSPNYYFNGVNGVRFLNYTAAARGFYKRRISYVTARLTR